MTTVSEIPKKPNKKPSTFRLSQTALGLVERLANESGVSKAAILEMAIRDYAQKSGVK